MNYIFYQTKTQFSNAGDALINRELIGLLRHYGKIHANCGKNIPGEFVKSLDIKDEEKIETSSVGWFLFILKCAFVSKFKKDKVFIFSGLGDAHGGRIKAVVKNYVASLVLLIYRIFGVRIVRIGRSYGKLTKAMEISERFRSLFVTDCYVRDTQSLEYCKKIGLKKVNLCPDMSWLLRHKVEQLNKNKAIFLTFKGSTYNNTDAEYEEAVITQCNHMLSFFRQVYGEALKVYVGYQVKADKQLCHKIYEQFHAEYNMIFMEEQMKLDTMDKVYSKVDFHISNRMHSLLFGYKYGSLPIALIDTNKHIKIVATYRDCGLENLMVDVFNDEFSKKAEKIVENKEEEFNKLIKCEDEQVQKIISVIEDILM